MGRLTRRKEDGTGGLKMNELICPYCHAVQQYHEPDEINADFANTTCENCGELFEYSVVVTREYDSWKMWRKDK